MAILFVEQLTVIDCAYLDVRRGLVGESWIVDVELEGDLDAQSMVLDFSEVKRRIKHLIDQSLDHTLLVPRLAGELTLAATADRCELLFRSDPGAIEHVSPAAAVGLLDAVEVTPGGVAGRLRELIGATLPAAVREVRVTLRGEAIEGAFYHYVHGLKKHDGACQRIAHGHRSRVEVRLEGVRDPELEMDVARRWLDIYLASAEDRLARGNGRVRYGYDAQEGRYELALPETRCEELDSDSTVECIASALAQRLAPRRPGRLVEVRAYEGVMKGAVARARR